MLAEAGEAVASIFMWGESEKPNQLLLLPLLLFSFIDFIFSLSLSLALFFFFQEFPVFQGKSMIGEKLKME